MTISQSINQSIVKLYIYVNSNHLSFNDTFILKKFFSNATHIKNKKNYFPYFFSLQKWASFILSKKTHFPENYLDVRLESTTIRKSFFFK